MITIVVTRHPALLALLRERRMVEDGTVVLSHVETPEQVRGKHVIGVLPLSLAAEAASVTEIALALTPEMRGKELDLETLRRIAGGAVRYAVSREQWLDPLGCPYCGSRDCAALSGGSQCG